MNYEKGFFETPEFRELLKKYEHARAMNVFPYFGIEELVDLLSYYLFMDRCDSAEEILTVARMLHPTAQDNAKMEIKLLLSKGEASRALEIFTGIKYTGDDEMRILHAEILLALKEFKKAREIAMEIIRKNLPGTDNLYEALEILLDCGFAVDALLICEEALKHSPKNRGLLEVKAECYIELQMTTQAIGIYNALLDEDPYSTFYWEQLGHIYYMIHRYGKALECFEYESTINDEIEYARMMQAYCYYFVGDYAKSREMFGWFSNKYPMSVMPQFYTALSYYNEGELQKALDCFKAIIDIAPEGTIEMMLARIDKAMILDELGEHGRAEEAISIAIMMHPDNMKQLLLHDTHLYELHDKENLTFDEMSILEQKEWSLDEEMYQWGTHLVEHSHPRLALRVFQYIHPFSQDTTEIDAYIAFILWKTGEDDKIGPAVERALEGRSDLLFKLFGIPYNANLTPQEFMDAITRK